MVIYSKDRVSSLNVLTYYVYVVESSILIVFCLSLGLAILSNSTIVNKWYKTPVTIRPLRSYGGILRWAGGSLCFRSLVEKEKQTYIEYQYVDTCINHCKKYKAANTYTYLSDKSTSSKVCTSSLSMSAKMFDMLRGIRITCTLLSVLLYAPIAIKMYSLIKRFKRSHVGKMSVRQQQRTRNMTWTIALITLNELVCFTVPDLILMIQGYDNMIFYIMNLNKGIVNIFIFLLTQRELFKELRSSLPCFTKNRKMQKIKINEVTLKYWKKTEIIASFQTKARLTSHNTVSLHHQQQQY
uniref:G-protein coupled receptors family 1 profile domain-containing protein n=1 Tax=Ditylenchus dipsaci TaxID=166011 RepID=A0A915CLA7_9BILA